MSGFNDLSASQAIYAHRYSLFHPEVAVRSANVPEAFGATPRMTPSEIAANDFALRALKMAGAGVVIEDIFSLNGYVVVNLEGCWVKDFVHRGKLQSLAVQVATDHDVRVTLELPESSVDMDLHFEPRLQSLREEESVWDKIMSVVP